MDKELTFNYGSARWWPDGFNRFRERLAVILGVQWETLLTNVREAGYPPPPYKEPLMYLLFHSDCEGDITWRQCERIAARLREVVASWPEGDYDRDQALKLAEGMGEAFRRHRSIEFL